MKKVICFVLPISILLSGCVSGQKISELESRIEYLESIVLSSERETSESDAASLEADSTIAPSEINSDGSENVPESTVDEAQFSYLLNDKSNDEIVELCLQIMMNKPSKGESYAEYKNSLVSAPLSSSEFEDRCEYYYGPYDYYYASFSITEDALLSICLNGIQKEMDGTIGYNMNLQPGIDVAVSICLTDYDRAAYIYDKLFQVLSEEYNKRQEEYKAKNFYSEVSDKRDSTQWVATGPFLSYTATFKRFMEMRKIDEIYVLTAMKTYDGFEE